MVKEGPRKEEIAGGPSGSWQRAQAVVADGEANRMELQRKRAGALGTRKRKSSRSKAQVGMSQSQMDDTT